VRPRWVRAPRRVCWGQGASLETGRREHGGEAFSLGRGKGRDVDQGLDVGHAAGGVGDHGSAVGVSDEHDRSADRFEAGSDVVGVAGESTEWVGDRDDGVAEPGEGGDLGVPSVRVCPGAVDEHDGWFRPAEWVVVAVSAVAAVAALASSAAAAARKRSCARFRAGRTNCRPRARLRMGSIGCPFIISVRPCW